MNIKASIMLHPLTNFVLYFGITEQTQDEEIRFIKMLNISFVIFVIYSLGCLLAGLVLGDYFLAWVQAPCLIALAFAIALAGRGHHSASITIVLTVLISVFSSQQIYYGGDAQLHIWLLVPIMASCLVYPPKHSRLALLLGGIAVMALAGIEFLDIPEKIISPLLDNPLGRANNMATLGVAMLGVGYFSRSLLLAAEAELRTERQRSEKLLNNILPLPIAERLKNEEEIIADSFENCSVLFCDIVGFTELSQKLSATQLVRMLNELFKSFDDLCEQYRVEKIKTIGDAYMVAAGIPQPREDHAKVLVDMSLAMNKVVQDFKGEQGQTLDIRIGIHSGTVVAGVIGKSKFAYDLWGDTVNTAARMESHGVAGRIQITEATKKLLGSNFDYDARGDIEIKGKGVMTTYLIRPR